MEWKRERHAVMHETCSFVLVVRRRSYSSFMKYPYIKVTGCVFFSLFVRILSWNLIKTLIGLIWKIYFRGGYLQPPKKKISSPPKIKVLLMGNFKLPPPFQGPLEASSTRISVEWKNRRTITLRYNVIYFLLELLITIS